MNSQMELVVPELDSHCQQDLGDAPPVLVLVLVQEVSARKQ